ncbi:putative G2/M phase-specific E3 ubiquitin-protein ligase-like [Apostichopus japonicus]|uniref:Putative G2/M phase-specific E3 ubiquitin-protein ligase-like n=1 Tax=Stichopus japonicus TaxID=307972 RepID=A0A2G8K5J5_STIJA|nr:putative G2/M phase-specific E3 ubiquitin-protein ligase-like [Apostichopus japonicus]
MVVNQHVNITLWKGATCSEVFLYGVATMTKERIGRPKKLLSISLLYQGFIRAFSLDSKLKESLQLHINSSVCIMIGLLELLDNYFHDTEQLDIHKGPLFIMLITKIPPNFTQAGLGNKKVLLSSNATPLEVRTSLYESFPKLERAGGFEYLKGNGTTKCLVPIPLPRDGYSATSLHAAAKKARVYLRPIQNNINLDVPHAAGSSSSNPLVDLMEKCKSCNSDVPQTLLRQHVKTCVSRRQLRMQDITDTTSTIPVTSDDSDSDFPEILSSDEGTATPAVGLHPSCLQSSQTTDNQSTLGTTHPQAGTTPTTTTVVGMVKTMTSVDHPYSLSSNTPRTEAQIINSRPSPTALSPNPTLSTTTSSTHSMASTSGEQNTNYMRSLPSTSASGTTHYEDDENVSYRSYLQDCIDVHDMSDADMEEDAQLNRAIAESLETYSKRDDVTSASLLLTLNQKIHNNSVFRFNVNRLHLWECAVRGFKRLSFAGDKRIVVHFTDSIGNIEGAVDQGGPLREFIRLMMKNLQKNNSVFDGPLDRRFLRMNTNALNGGLFKVAGTMVAVSLIHGGLAPHFFWRSLFNIVSYGFEAAAPLVEEVRDPETKLLIEAIVNATSTEELNDAIESASFLMGLAGTFESTHHSLTKNQLLRN